MKQAFTFASLIAVSFLTGCYDPHAQDSPIVREVQAAGAGNLSMFTYQGLAEWFHIALLSPRRYMPNAFLSRRTHRRIGRQRRRAPLVMRPR